MACRRFVGFQSERLTTCHFSFSFRNKCSGRLLKSLLFRSKNTNRTFVELLFQNKNAGRTLGKHLFWNRNTNKTLVEHLFRNKNVSRTLGKHLFRNKNANKTLGIRLFRNKSKNISVLPEKCQKVLSKRAQGSPFYIVTYYSELLFSSLYFLGDIPAIFVNIRLK